MENKLIIAGADGYIGQRLQRNVHLNGRLLLLSPFQSVNYIPFDLLNTSDFNFDLINETDTIIFLAGISSPDLCSSKFQMAFDINVTGTIQFINACLRKRARVLFFSSDTIYGNSQNENNEDVFPSEPAGEYGYMKLLVEKYYREEPGFKSFRLSYVFSWNDRFTSYLRSCHEQKKTAEVFDPFIRKAVYIEDLITCIVNIFNNWENFNNRYFNICGPQYLSRTEMAELFKRNIGDLDVQIITPDENFFKSRPQKIIISSKYSTSLLGKDFTRFEDALQKEKSLF